MPEHTIAENLARLQAAKTAIGNAIVAKGGTVNSGDGLEEYPADIASIETAELTSISITVNGVYDTGSTTSGYNHVDVNVPNTYSSSDEGKVVSNRQLIPQIAKPDTIITNNTYDTTNYNSVTVNVENSYSASDEGKVVSNGALVSQTAKPDTITTNSTYNTMLYSSVTVNVENSYSASDEGKVVSNGALVAQTAKPTDITSNNTYDTTTYNSVTVDVPNTYTQSDEGKVVNNGALTAQTAKPTEITVNDTYDTTMYNSVTVDVPNTYTVEDEGKVVSNGTLVAQTAKPDVIAENGVYNTTLYNSVNIYVSPELQVPNDVNFYDYDGTIVKSYTAAEFANISELPDNPSHAGLTSQGWNWSLADAKAYVAKYGKLEIGQMYITDDGKTRIYITLSDARTSPFLRLYLDINSEVDIDWGDGSPHSTFTTISQAFKSEQHEYSNGGDYVIAITPIQGKYQLRGDGSSRSIIDGGFGSRYSPDVYYDSIVTKIEIGSDVVMFQGAQFDYSLTSITIPNSVTEIGESAFQNCESLKSITIPNSVTELKNTTFNLCAALASISLPKTLTLNTNTNCFNRCYSLQHIALPESVVTIGEYTFYECWALSSVVIPDSTTKIGEAAFYNCYSLTSITIPNSVTEIASSGFSSCSAITSITIPESVTQIGSYAFGNNYSLGIARFEKNSVSPPIFTSTVFSRLPNDFKVLVPALYILSYKTATNYPNPNTYKYIGYGTYAIGETLPTTISGGYYRLTWYATIDDCINQSNPITTGNGSEVYARETAI